MPSRGAAREGPAADIRAVENYLKATQLIVERQVMLEAKIVDVQLFETYQTGVNWAYFGELQQSLLARYDRAGNT